MDLLSLPGPVFLALLLGGAALAASVRIGSSSWLRRSRGKLAREPLPVGAYALASLSSGSYGAVATAITVLAARDLVEVQPETLVITALGQVEADAPALERAAHTAAAHAAAARIPLDRLQQEVRGETDAINRELLQAGLVLDENTAAAVRWSGAVPFFLVAAIGAAECLFRAHLLDWLVGPVVLASLLAVVAGAHSLMACPWRTVEGERLLRSLQQKHRSLPSRLRRRGSTLSIEDIRMGVALFGAAAYPDSPLAPVGSGRRLEMNDCGLSNAGVD